MNVIVKPTRRLAFGAYIDPMHWGTGYERISKRWGGSDRYLRLGRVVLWVETGLRYPVTVGERGVW